MVTDLIECFTTVCCKVEQFHGCKIKLQFTGKHLWLGGSLVHMAKAYYCTGLLFKAYYFTRKVSQLPVDPRKLQNFSTLNDLQYSYTVSHSFMSKNKVSTTCPMDSNRAYQLRLLTIKLFLFYPYLQYLRTPEE